MSSLGTTRLSEVCFVYCKPYYPQSAVQALINTLQILRVVAPAMHSSLQPQVAALLPAVCACCWHPRSAVRSAAAAAAAVLAAAHPDDTLSTIARFAQDAHRNTL